MKTVPWKLNWHDTGVLLKFYGEMIEEFSNAKSERDRKTCIFYLNRYKRLEKLRKNLK